MEAQTLANVYMALDHDLEIIPVINKIDLPVTRIDEVRHEIENIIGLDASDAILVSAKQGIGIEECIEAIIRRIPAPRGNPQAPLKALIFDSKYDNFRGVITYIRIVEGTLRKRDRIRFMRQGSVHEAIEIGQFRPDMRACESLGPGQAGYIITGIKELDEGRGVPHKDVANWLRSWGRKRERKAPRV